MLQWLSVSAQEAATANSECSENFTVWSRMEGRCKCVLKIWRKMSPLAYKEHKRQHDNNGLSTSSVGVLLSCETQPYSHGYFFPPLKGLLFPSSKRCFSTTFYNDLNFLLSYTLRILIFATLIIIKSRTKITSFSISQGTDLPVEFCIPSPDYRNSHRSKDWPSLYGPRNQTPGHVSKMPFTYIIPFSLNLSSFLICSTWTSSPRTRISDTFPSSDRIILTLISSFLDAFVQ